MGQNLSAEVFKPPDPPGYDETLPGLQYLEKDGRKVPYIFYKYEDSSEAKEGSELTEEPDPFRDHWTIMYFTDTATDMGVFGKWLKIMSTVLKVRVLDRKPPHVLLGLYRSYSAASLGSRCLIRLLWIWAKSPRPDSI